MKDKCYKRKLNNKGSSLIIVIICSMFVSILGMLMLSLTKMNFDMKNTSIKAKDNFYTAENALDELKNGVYENAQNKMAKVYEDMLVSYTSLNETQRIKNMKKNFVKEFYSYYTSNSSEEEHVMTDDELRLFYDYFVTTKIKDDTNFGVSIISNPTVRANYDDYKVVFSEVSIAYLNEQGYESKVTTDIVISCDYPEHVVKKGDGTLYYSDYAIINDGTLKNTLTSTTINGNVYSGKGIEVANQGVKLNINAGSIITREDIVVSNKALFKADLLPSIANKCEIWANNISTKLDTSYVAPSEYININADCYVKDDLTLLAKGGNVTIKGDYYGYSSGNSSVDNVDGEALYSSAININGQYATLDLSGLSRLHIAGKSYLNVPDRYGSTVKSDTSVNVLMGESVSFKGNQIAYLLPSVCIQGLSHNPLTSKEYQQILDGEYSIDITLSGKSGGIALENYLNPITPYVALPVRYVGNTGVEGGMFYIYMKFQNEDKAALYYQEYYERYGIDLNEKTASSNTGNIILNEDIITTGNALMYTDEQVSLVNANKSYNSSDIESVEIMYNSYYDGLTQKLDKDYVSDANNDLTDNLIWFENDTDSGTTGVIYDSSIRGGYAYTLNENANNPYYVCITDRDVTVDTVHNNGLIITTGNVYVNASFKGLIIAKGDVIVAGNSTISYSEKILELIKSDSNIYKYFKDYVPDSEISDVENNKEAVYVYYDNWYKD